MNTNKLIGKWKAANDTQIDDSVNTELCAHNIKQPQLVSTYNVPAGNISECVMIFFFFFTHGYDNNAPIRAPGCWGRVRVEIYGGHWTFKECGRWQKKVFTMIFTSSPGFKLCPVRTWLCLSPDGKSLQRPRRLAVSQLPDGQNLLGGVLVIFSLWLILLEQTKVLTLLSTLANGKWDWPHHREKKNQNSFINVTGSCRAHFLALQSFSLLQSKLERRFKC